MEFEHLIRIAYLINRHLTDTLSEEEKRELEQWLAEDEQHSRLMENLFRRNSFTEKQIQEHLYNAANAFQFVKARRSRRFWRYRMLYGGVAALLVLTLGLGAVLWTFAPVEETPVVATSDFSAGASKAVLILTDGQRMELGQTGENAALMQEGVRLNASGEEIEYKGESKDTVRPGYNTLEVPRKGEFKLVLADGTKVWMNSESRLRYPVYFSGKERRVYLEGEAFFEVARNEKQPFVVDMGKARVQVLGTCFNVRAYRDESNICATLTKGKIRLEAGEESLLLHPEEQGVADLNRGGLFRQKVNSRLYTAWKDGRFVFQEQSLEEMMNTLSRWYDLEVFFENASIREVTFTGNLKRYDSFDKIIELLEMTGTAHFKIKGNAIFISE